MIYLVHGKAKIIFQAFGHKGLIQDNKNIKLSAKDIYEQELPQTTFIGTQEQSLQFAHAWKTTVQESYYMSGNISAKGYIAHLIGKTNPLRKKHELLVEYQQNVGQFDFAYLNDAGEPSAFNLIYRKDEPTQWILVLVKNTHLEPTKREMLCFAGFNLKPLIKKSDIPSIPVYSTQELPQQLLKAMNSSFAMQWLDAMLDTQQGQLVANFERLKLYFRRIETTSNTSTLQDPIQWTDWHPKNLFVANPALDLIMKMDLNISSAMLKQCFIATSPLRQQLDKMQWTKDEAINKNLLALLLVFLEKEVLALHEDFLQEQVFNRCRAGSVWDLEQINIIPFLLKKGYPLDLFQRLLSQAAYYSAVTTLIELGLTQDIPQLFTNSNKLKELKFIHAKAHGAIKTLCLVFWVRGNLTTCEYDHIIQAAKQHPLMAETLLALDKRRIHSIDELKRIALTPKKHYQQSLLYHFAPEFKQHNLNYYALNRLTQEELTLLSLSFQILRDTDIHTGDFYKLTMRNDDQASLIRLLLPGLGVVKNTEHRKELITLLFMGVQKGPITQGKAILTITDPVLLPLARTLQSQFVCTKTLQCLGFNQATMSFVAGNSEKSEQFRRVLLEVEKQCKTIYELLSEGSNHRTQMAQWLDAEEIYRKQVYKLTQDALTQSPVNFARELRKAQDKILSIVDSQERSWVEKILITLANVLIYLCTLGIAHRNRAKQTGNPWFFTHTKSGEDLRILNEKIIQNIVLAPEDHKLETDLKSSTLSFNR